MRKIFVGVWLIAVVSVTAFVWFIRGPHSSHDTYYTSLISEGDSLSNTTVFGKIIFDKEMILVPASDGNVIDVFVKPGDMVKAGKLLVSLDYSESDLKQFDQLKTMIAESGSVDRLNKSLAQINKLEKKGFYDSVEAAKKRAEIYSSLSQIINFKNNLQKLHEQTYGKMIHAPFDGIITNVKLKEGQRVSVRDDKSEISVSIAPLNYKLGVELEILDELLPKMKIGQPIRVSVPLSTEYFSGEITSISRHVYDDKKKRYFVVLAKINDKEKQGHLLASGMKVVVDVETGKAENLTWLPKAAFDINIEDKHVSSHLNFVPSMDRTVATSRGPDHTDDHSKDIDKIKDQSGVSKIVANENYPNESSISEVFALTADNKVIKISVLKASESGEMISIHGKDMLGMRVITHYRPKAFVW